MQKITVLCIFYAEHTQNCHANFLLSFKFMWNLHEQTFSVLFFISSQKVFVIFAI